jgi:hypothetical protein
MLVILEPPSAVGLGLLILEQTLAVMRCLD